MTRPAAGLPVSGPWRPAGSPLRFSLRPGAAGGLRYHRPPLRRFLLLALPLLVLAIAVFHFALEALGLADGAGLAVRLGSPPGSLPAWALAGTWVLEAVALTALFLLVQIREVWWLDGLLAGWIAWVFRGPLLVVTLVAAAGVKPGPWWTLAFYWLVLYSLCGLLLGALAESAGLGRPDRAAAPTAEPPPAGQPREPDR
jgi:hypothetical protein